MAARLHRTPIWRAEIVAVEDKTVTIPADLVFAVDQMVKLVEAGWEVCGFQGGGSGKVQFQKVEFRRRRDA